MLFFYLCFTPSGRWLSVEGNGEVDTLTLQRVASSIGMPECSKKKNRPVLLIKVGYEQKVTFLFGIDGWPAKLSDSLPTGELSCCASHSDRRSFPKQHAFSFFQDRTININQLPIWMEQYVGTTCRKRKSHAFGRLLLEACWFRNLGWFGEERRMALRHRNHNSDVLWGP